MCCFSAGVGRTGTFICVDHLLQHIRDYDGINVFGMVLEMRQYRCNMVQTEVSYLLIYVVVGSGDSAVERRTVNRGDGGSIPPTAVSKLRQFRSPHIACLSEETLKADGPFCLVSMPGEVKDPTQGVNV